MSVRIFYVDESYDDEKFCLSAIAIRHSVWNECFERVKEHRKQLKADHGILLSREIHASEFVAGRGRLGPQLLNKWIRSRIFFSLLEVVSTLPKVLVFNVCLNSPKYEDPQMVAWDRLVNRIERTMLEFEKQELPIRRELLSAAQDGLSESQRERLDQRINSYHARAMIVADAGREREITRAIRKMHVFNPIPSQFGTWGTGQTTQNIVTDRVIEDPIFKVSERSYFIQLADCVAFALLKRETTPVPHITKYGTHKMFDQTIGRVCYTKASPRDTLGIVRA